MFSWFLHPKNNWETYCVNMVQKCMIVVTYINKCSIVHTYILSSVAERANSLFITECTSVMLQLGCYSSCAFQQTRLSDSFLNLILHFNTLTQLSCHHSLEKLKEIYQLCWFLFMLVKKCQQCVLAVWRKDFAFSTTCKNTRKIKLIFTL